MVRPTIFDTAAKTSLFGGDEIAAVIDSRGVNILVGAGDIFVARRGGIPMQRVMLFCFFTANEERRCDADDGAKQQCYACING